MHIRRVLPIDAKEFQLLRLEALREVPTAFGSTYEEECETPISRIADRLAATDRAVFGASIDPGTPFVGLIGLGREDMRSMRHKAYLWTMYVTQKQRGRGVGAKLLDQALEFALSLPEVLQINLTVNLRNVAAIQLYESRGFQAFGREESAVCIDGQFYDDLHMVWRKSLTQ